MSIVQVLLENKSIWKNSHALSLENREILAAFDEAENSIAIGEAWAYVLDTGMIMAAPSDNHYPQENSSEEKQIGEPQRNTRQKNERQKNKRQKEELPKEEQQKKEQQRGIPPKAKLQKIEVLYLLPGDLTLEEHDRILDVETQAFPLPPAYCAGQILCQNNVFTISSKAGNPSICGTYPIIYGQLFSAAHAYYTRGLAAKVLERYYYEFLAERHQLYLEEEMFKQEMKERKKRKKSLKKENISEENFMQDKNREYTCTQKINLWNITTTLYTEFKENPKHKEWILKKYIHQLNTYISWMEAHEKDIEKELLNANMVELANYWMEGREVLDEHGQTYYELDSGESFPFPITETSFLENLFLESLHIRSSQPESASIQLFFGTVPEFFADHSIEVFIHVNTNWQKNVPTKTTYQIQVGGLAG